MPALSGRPLNVAPLPYPVANARQRGDIPRCTSGQPGYVPNPVFPLGGVPSGTARIRLSDVGAASLMKYDDIEATVIKLGNWAAGDGKN